MRAYGQTRTLSLAHAQAQRTVSRTERNHAVGIFHHGKAEYERVTRHNARSAHLNRRTRTPGYLAQKQLIARARRPKRQRPRIGVIVRTKTDNHIRHASIGIRTHDERTVRGRQIEDEPPLFLALRFASRIQRLGMLS